MNTQENPLGEFAGHTDVGSPKLPGSATHDAARQEYTLAATGTNPASDCFPFQFIWKKMEGDFILRARAEFIGPADGDHPAIGWMARPGLDGGARFVNGARHGEDGASLQFRRSPGAGTEQLALPVTNPDVLQFERKGATFIFSAAVFISPSSPAK